MFKDTWKEIQLELKAVDPIPSEKPQKSKRKQTDERSAPRRCRI